MLITLQNIFNVTKKPELSDVFKCPITLLNKKKLKLAKILSKLTSEKTRKQNCRCEQKYFTFVSFQYVEIFC